MDATRIAGADSMSTRPIHLALDVDGVFADFNAAFRKKLIDLTGVDKFQDQPATTWHYATEQFGYDREDVRRVWRQIHDSPNFWLDINPRPGAIQFFNELRRREGMTFDYTFITSRRGFRAKRQTQHWLGMHGIDHPTVILTADKADVYAVLKITHVLDDAPWNVQAALDLGLDAYLVEAPYNAEDRASLMAQGAVTLSNLADFWEYLDGTAQEAA